VRDEPLGLGAEHGVAAGVVAVVVRVEHGIDPAPARFLFQPFDADLGGVGELRVDGDDRVRIDQPPDGAASPREDAHVPPDIRERRDRRGGGRLREQAGDRQGGERAGGDGEELAAVDSHGRKITAP
jgi:hypothetical protein